MSDRITSPSEPTEEFLVSKPGVPPAQASSRLNELVGAVAAINGINVVKTVGQDDIVNLVVISTTPFTLKQVADRFPDLSIEKNQPLQLFGPDF